MSIEIRSNNEHLIAYANSFGTSDYFPPLPLRRALSLFRNYGFGTLVCESSEWNPTNKNEHGCNKNNSGISSHSCKEYIECLEENYETKIIKKECFKIAFFKPEFEDINSIELNNTDLLGYCILHKDTSVKGGIEKIEPPYVPETIISLPEKRGDVSLLGQYGIDIIIAGRKFHIIGNYFSQQNSVTNCCAHAAIKMAIRSYYPDVTAEKINKIAGINHKESKGDQGFRPMEFVNVMKTLSQQNVTFIEARAQESPLQFFKLIHHAIESSFPVILLFGTEDSIKLYEPRSSHAVSLIGSTFNKNTWWAYAWKGYFPKSQSDSAYLPSVIWCDNFVIQDDNIGPYYYLPIHSLTISNIPAWIPLPIRRIVHSLKFRVSKTMPWFYKPANCIVTYPKYLKYFEDVLKVEPYSFEWLNSFIETIKNDKEVFKNVYFEKYFFPYLKNGYLVLRTFAISKQEYLASILKDYDIEEKKDLCDAIEYKFPNFLWITEFSIPELYWINKLKLGELIIDPLKFHENNKNPYSSVIYIKLPGFVNFFGENTQTKRIAINENDSRYPLIKTNCTKSFEPNQIGKTE